MLTTSPLATFVGSEFGLSLSMDTPGNRIKLFVGPIPEESVYTIRGRPNGLMLLLITTITPMQFRLRGAATVCRFIVWVKLLQCPPAETTVSRLRAHTVPIVRILGNLVPSRRHSGM